MSSELSKNWKAALLGASLATAAPSPASQEPRKISYDPHTLHPELAPIAFIESSNGKNMNHAAHSKGDYHTAMGVVGFKPSTAHEIYLRSSHLQKLYPNLHSATNFMQEMKDNPQFYNHLAGSHWNQLKKLTGSKEKAAFAWRHGQGKAARADDNIVQNDPYVKKYKELSNSVNKEEIDVTLAKSGLFLLETELKKAIKDIKPGKLVGIDGKNKVYDYSHVLHPTHQQAGYNLEIHEEPEGHFTAWLKHHENPTEIGNINFIHNPENKSIDPGYAEIHDEHQGKGLGQSMYEAGFAHGLHLKGVSSVSGKTHSSMASRVHSKVSQKHGLNYAPQPNNKPSASTWSPPTGAFDNKFGPYQYHLKNDPELAKAIEDWSKKRGV
jgi:hypothetical protein